MLTILGVLIALCFVIILITGRRRSTLYYDLLNKYVAAQTQLLEAEQEAFGLSSALFEMIKARDLKRDPSAGVVEHLQLEKKALLLASNALKNRSARLLKLDENKVLQENNR